MIRTPKKTTLIPEDTSVVNWHRAKTNAEYHRCLVQQYINNLVSLRQECEAGERPLMTFTPYREIHIQSDDGYKVAIEKFLKQYNDREEVLANAIIARQCEKIFIPGMLTFVLFDGDRVSNDTYLGSIHTWREQHDHKPSARIIGL